MPRIARPHATVRMLAALAVPALLLWGCYPAEPVTPHDVAFGSALYLDRALGDADRIAGITELAGMAGVEWTREEFHWDSIEPQRGVFSQRELARYDAAVAAITAQGIKIMGLLAYNNPWSSGTTDPDTDAERADFARFAAAMAERYKGVISHWEIWNEPNLDRFWEPEPDAAAYGLLLRAAAEAVRAANPEAKIVGGATSGTDVDFLMDTLNAAGPGVVDILSFHPYCGDRAWDRSDEPKDLRQLNRALTEAGVSLPLWVTEFGYATTQADNGVDEYTQSALMVRAFLAQFAEGVENIITYDFVDDGITPNENEEHFGLVDHILVPKPAWQTFGVMTSLLSGARIEERRMENGITAVRFTSAAGQAVWAVWDARIGVKDGSLENSRDRLFELPGLGAGTVALNVNGATVPLTEKDGKLYLSVEGAPRYLVSPLP